MRVFLLVGVLVVLAVLARPPERTLLYRHAPDPCDDELEGPTGLVAAVGEVPVEADYHSEHTSISLGAASIYSFNNLVCLAKYSLAKAGLHHSSMFPRLSA